MIYIKLNRYGIIIVVAYNGLHHIFSCFSYSIKAVYQTININVEINHQKLLDQYPFLSYLTYGGNEYIGIIQNLDDVITSIYDFGILRTADQKRLYLELGEVWWWESNRMVPINIFLKTDWFQFRPTLKTFNSKDVELKYGPALSLKESAQKRSKRRSITLVRRIV